MSQPERIGLIAGAGSFPLLFAAEAKKAGHEVIVAGLKGITPAEIEPLAAKISYFRLGQLTDPINFFKENGVKKVLMAGSVPHIAIFGGILPDLRAAKLIFRLKDKKANAILGAIADELAADGLELVNSATMLEHLLVKPGLMAGRKLSGDALKCAAFGWKAAKSLAALDIGLTVVLRDRVVLAAEAQEGTDACITRAGEILRRLRESGQKGHAMMVVKVARPGQDMRFDLPVAGAPTLRTMHAAGADTLVLEAGRTLILGMEEFLAAAKETGITIFGAGSEESFK
ncbi:MAG: UDP-2,3-diacylglucosamine diphosphatase LpxI [Elusimicrobiota bacterium]